MKEITYHQQILAFAEYQGDGFKYRSLSIPMTMICCKSIMG